MRVQVSLNPADKKTDSMKNRDLCLVTIQGKNLSTSMVEAGAAYVYDKFIKPELANELYTAQSKAEKNKTGVWSEPRQEKPWDYRRRMAVTGR